MKRVLISIIIMTSVLVLGQGKHTSPYSTSKSLDLTIASLSGGLLLGSTLIDYFPMSLEDISILSADNIPDYDSKAIKNWSLKSIKMSDILLYSSIAAPGLLLMDQRIRDDYHTFSILWVESLFLTLGITNLTKVLVQRPRPYLYGKKHQQNSNKKMIIGKVFSQGILPYLQYHVF